MEGAEYLLDGKLYTESFLKIKLKDGSVAPFKLNPAQIRLYEALKKQDDEGKPMRAIVLKARQLGFSTFTEAMIFHRAATMFGQNALIVAHKEESTSALFQMSKRYLENLPEPLKPMTKAANAQAILFQNPNKNERERAKNPGLGSQIICKTAGGSGIGRSYTLQMVHASEFAFWPGDKTKTWVGIMQAVPAERGTMVVVESTANGYDEFHSMWEAAERGDNDFIPMFFPWYENADYRKKPAPGTEWTEAERELAERYGLDEEQLAWRRWCIKNNCAGDEDMFRQEYPSYPEEAFLTTGSAVFDAERLRARLQSVGEPERIGEFIYDEDPKNPTSIWNIRWIDKQSGCIRLYETPQRGYPYVVGGDTAGSGSDWFTGQVINNHTGRQAAVLRRQYDEDQYAKQMYCLGKYYNDALVGVETNYSTYPVKMMELMGYPRLYVRQVPDTFTGEIKKSFGWDTNSKTRPLAVAELVQSFRDDPESIRDRMTLQEMQCFQYTQDRRRPEALPGEHDDLVMALAIAIAIRGEQTMTLPEKHRSTKHWTKDMWEDFRKADRETRAYLMAKWGKDEDGI